MSPHLVLRRFEVHGERAALAGMHAALQPGGAASSPGLTAQIALDPRTPSLSVRVTGGAARAANIRKSFADDRFTVVRDWLEVLPPSLGETYPDLRALLRIDPDESSRAIAGTGQQVVVAVVDSGICVDVPEFHGHLWTGPSAGVHGARFVDGALQDYDVTDQDGHGTRLAGTILATANFAHGIEIMALKFYDVVTQPAAANAAAALRFAAAQKPAIINLSFDLGIGSDKLQAAVRAACLETDALIVIAAGNTGSDNDAYPLVPACYAEECRERVVVVMATDLYDERPTFSNFGARSVDFAAPGVGIMSTRPPASRGVAALRYGRYTGTSAAAAHVAGAAALLKAQDPGLGGAELKELLIASLDDLPRLRCRNRGRLNLGRALRLLNPATPPVANGRPGGPVATGP